MRAADAPWKRRRVRSDSVSVPAMKRMHVRRVRRCVSSVTRTPFAACVRNRLAPERAKIKLKLLAAAPGPGLAGPGLAPKRALSTWRGK